jgi:hypothetical protein
MERHVWLLRRYYADHLRREREPNLWTERLVVEWLCLLRVPPFDRVYQVLPREAPWPICSSTEKRGAPSLWVESAFPGGAKLRCRCGASWLQLDRRRQ